MLPRLNLNSLQISPRRESPLALTSGSGSFATEKKELRSTLVLGSHFSQFSRDLDQSLSDLGPDLCAGLFSVLLFICLHLSLPNQCKLTSEYFQHLVW